ncbi:MAG: hypothetical protein OXE17_03000 [Chloroflexi bacterium]|nr:hypothetical protein [Chloroflexota bacterium]
MTRKQVIIRGEEFILEPLSPSVVKVEYRDQVGWVGSSLTATATIQSALRCLSFSLIEVQRKEEALRINPEARRGMAQWQLHEYLEGLEDGDEI